MKKLLFLLVFAPAFLFAQQNAVSDTSYRVKDGATFFEVKIFKYADGSEQTFKTLIGDSATLVAAARARLSSQAATMAVDVRYVSKYRRQFSELLREAAEVQALTGTDPQKQVQQEFQEPFLQSGWTIRRDGTNSPVNFSLNAQGMLRYNVNGGSNSQANLIGQAVRLRNYPSSGTFTDLFRNENGVWVNAEGTIILRPPGNNSPVNRAVAPAKATTKGN